MTGDGQQTRANNKSKIASFCAEQMDVLRSIIPLKPQSFADRPLP